MVHFVFGVAAVALIVFAAEPHAAAQNHQTWRDYGGAADSSQYSALAQINRSNVSQLEVAWSYPTGDNNKYFFNPLVVDTVMYVLARNNSIVALDAATGGCCLPATISCGRSTRGPEGRFSLSAAPAASTSRKGWTAIRSPSASCS